jgi:hypothetical protein
VGVQVNVRPAETTGAAASDLGGRKFDRMTHSKTLAANLNTCFPSTSGDSARPRYRGVAMLEMVAEERTRQPCRIGGRSPGTGFCRSVKGA